MALARVSEPDVAAFLATYHGEPVHGLELLRGGFWSAAYGYSMAGPELVARFGQLREGFEMDRDAMAFNGPDLPVPDVVEVGDAFDGAFAISVRHHGRFLEDIDVGDAAAASTVDRLLAALRAAGSCPDAFSAWYPTGADPRSSPGVAGWATASSTIRRAQSAELDAIFEACTARVRQLVEACPERRDLVHGDLLHQNAMLTDDLDAVSTLFSWKCSVRGDFLFDVAWCTFWSSWHPGIAAIHLWRRTWAAANISADDLVDAALRHHCYELHTSDARTSGGTRGRETPTSYGLSRNTLRTSLSEALSRLLETESGIDVEPAIWGSLAQGPLAEWPTWVTGKPSSSSPTAPTPRLWWWATRVQSGTSRLGRSARDRTLR